MNPLRTFCCLVLLATLGGCAQEQLDTSYGRHRSRGNPGSVNGTDVLAAMFTDAGHDVHFRRTLVTDEMDAADVVVWFPNDTAAPSEEVCDWFDYWLGDAPGRMLILVGRDFDAAPQYFEFMLQKSDDSGGNTPQDAKESPAATDASQSEPSPKAEEPEKDEANSGEEAEREDTEENNQACEWFDYADGAFTRVKELSGPWAEGIDPQKARIEIGTRMIPTGDTEVLLDSETGPIVSRQPSFFEEESHVLLIENGSFLLNLPLVNHEHRKLAGEVVAQAGEAKKVVFLESGRGGPPIDPPPVDSSLWTLFEGWPLGAILLQLAVAGVIFCFARWPIFGRPKQPPPPVTTDFATHVDAVGQLLARTREPPRIAQPAPATPIASTAPPTLDAPSDT